MLSASNNTIRFRTGIDPTDTGNDEGPNLIIANLGLAIQVIQSDNSTAEYWWELSELTDGEQIFL